MPPNHDHADGSRSTVSLFGRVIGWREYGDPSGVPVLFVHGWPGSSAQGICVDAPARARGLRIISIDRPGMGRSSRIPSRRFMDFPPLAAAVMDALGGGTFHVFGVSGGGPYALACAASLGSRVLSVLDCCGAPPLDDRSDRRHFSPIYRFMLWLHDHAPGLLHALLVPLCFFARFQLPWPLMRLMLIAVPARDRAALSQRARFEEYFPSFHGAMVAGASAIYEDGQRYAEPWDFNPATITVPVRIWHGRCDNNFHWTLAEKLAARIPHAEFRLTDEGHYSLPIFQAEAMLDDMMAAARSSAPAPA
jgi:pimeloyl-ACP methyl ester carboxylesterase